MPPCVPVGPWPRRDERWTIEDDRRLVRFARRRLGVHWRERSLPWADERTHRFAKREGRTLGGVLTRWGILRVVLEYLAASGAGLGCLDWGK
jgi:hypothetical protein